ncbi:MAG: ATP-binding protein [Gammaproteobacteria bacterium]|nr:ATP-binding protein [Gammaproteobacteria bacterium]
MPTTISTIYEICKPRADVLDGAVVEADFAADLAQVIAGEASPEYSDPARFFANTHPTQGLRNLLANVASRLSGAGSSAAAIFRLDTSYGGGKTHGLIALAHAARGMADVPNASEFVDLELLPQGPVRVAAFDGENADPANGRSMGEGSEGVLAHTPWGELAFELAGPKGYARVRTSDEERIAPGADTLRELFGGEPTLILLDELSVYLRKVRRLQGAAEQLTAFLTALFKAVESTPNAALVYTLAIGRDGRGTDAYSEENQFIAERMAEAESVSARKATLLNPTDEDEYPQVLCRRLFESIDDQAAMAVVDAYRGVWQSNSQAIDADAQRADTVERFRASYPFHPEVLDTLTEKAFTLSGFQRIRGMLRMLGRTVAHLWAEKPKDATAIHLHHIDIGHEPIRQEVVTRLGQATYVPAISNDITGASGNPALAERIDADRHKGLPPYAGYVARTTFLHTLAFNEPLKGVSHERLRYSIAGPATDLTFIEEARTAFVTDSAFLDDRPGAPMRFLAEPNLTKLIQTEEQNVDAGDARAHLDDRIREIFVGPTFDAVRFPGGPFDVPDEVADGKPKLIVLAYDGVSISGVVDQVPQLVDRIYARKGSDGAALRALRNNLVFVAADDARRDDMRRAARRRLALAELIKPERIGELAEHQQSKVRELEQRSEHALAVAIQQCFRHVYYPSRNRLQDSDVDLAHSTIEATSSSERPGSGQQQVVRVLRDLNKLRLAEDEPDSPTYVRDRTPLRKGQMTTLELRNEFRRDPALPMLIGDDVFIRGIRTGVESGEYVYQRGKLLYGPGDPGASIDIDAQALVMTMAFARNSRVWPRPPEVRDEDAEPPKKEPGSDDAEKDGGEQDEAKHSSPPEGDYSAEGLLKEALTKVWEQARGEGKKAIGRLHIRLFESGDAFKLLGAVRTVQGATKSVSLNGGYETADGASFQLEFKGPLDDAQPVREFLDPQFRAATNGTLEAGIELQFEHGLPLSGDASEKLTDRLARFAGEAVHVTAEALD